MQFTLLRKLKKGDKFRKLIHRNNGMYSSKKLYVYDGYDRRAKAYFYYSLTLKPFFYYSNEHYIPLEEFDSKTGDILVIIGG